MNLKTEDAKVIFLCVIIAIVFNDSVALVPFKNQKENYEPDYSVYHNLSSIMHDMTKIVDSYGEYIRRNDEFISEAGRSQFLIRISNFSSEKTREGKVKVLLAFGEHAREFFPIESLFYFLRNLTKGLDSEKSQSYAYSTWVVNNFDLYIISITNPDGRDYIEQTRNYCWRGTRSGIDLNRNFDWNYGGTGSSRNLGDEEYRGPRAFSEPETHVFRKLIASTSFDAFLSFHSGIRHIYIPFADSKSKQQHRLPKNKEHLFKLARQMSNSSPSRPFKFGLAYELIDYTADGTSFDYMAGVAQVPFSLAVEMWEHEHHTGPSCFDEFNPRSEQLEFEVALVHPLYVELLSYLFTWKKRKLKTLPGLVRVKKDDSVLNQPHEQDAMFASQPALENNAPNESQFVCALFALVAVICVFFGVRHIWQLMRKKRVISLKSLSSTFSMYKSL